MTARIPGKIRVLTLTRESYPLVFIGSFIIAIRKYCMLKKTLKGEILKGNCHISRTESTCITLVQCRND